jgi:curved DNA-binding protein CbpA
MGADFSKLPAEHRRIYQNILNIQSPGTRAQMIQTLLSSPEHTESARASGVYGHLLHYVQCVKEGRAPPPLPGQGGAGSGPGQGQGTQAQQARGNPNSQMTVHRTDGSTVTTSQRGNEKAINYFSACLRILGLEEEVALTDAILKAAYKKAALRAHPDKGGSEKEFEAVTKAFAYLGEILTRIRGGRAVDGKVEAPTALASGREEAADKWKITPVQLNPSKLNVDAFNSMFEKTRIPDPEESGYGDWLKGADENKSVNFSGKFNRDVFHKAFEEESSQRPMRGGGNAIIAQELSLARGMGYATELGRTSRDDYTVAAVETGKGQSFTDLKKAYTEYNTFTHQTANVKVSANRNLDQMATERKSAPAPLADAEMSALRDAEMALARQEELRKRRVAEEAIAENSYFERMKRLVIRN